MGCALCDSADEDCLRLKDADFLPLAVRWLKYGVVRAVCNACRISGVVLRGTP